jgi:glycosyltransferase involved in cell wall biosynthesis
MTRNLDYNFAAFIITKDRHLELIETIKKLLSQSFPPSYILVVDNGTQTESRDRINDLNDTRISYHLTGYNAGPAGGAYWGLKLLFEKDYDWVLWVDDDDPPKFDNLIEDMFDIVLHNDSDFLGMVGSVGENFDRKKGRVVRFKDEHLKGYLEVDTISGNMFPLVSKRTFEKGILPNKDLFFGFEELDFGLSLKRAGFKILTSGTLHLKHRIQAGRLNLITNKNQKKLYSTLWREYYSARNLAFILFHQEKSLIGTLTCICRNIIKSFVVFRHGLTYGNKVSSLILMGLFDGLFRRMDMRVSPVAKSIKL